jgi:hypothetical protein
MFAAGRRFVRFWPEVRHASNQPVGKFEEHHRVIGAAIEKPLEPHHRVTLVTNHELLPEMPVTGVLLIEPQVAITPPDALPRLRYLIDHGRMQQCCPGVPVPGLQVRDEELCQLTVAAHHRKLPHGRPSYGGLEPLSVSWAVPCRKSVSRPRPLTCRIIRGLAAKWSAGLSRNAQYPAVNGQARSPSRTGRQRRPPRRSWRRCRCGRSLR